MNVLVVYPHGNALNPYSGAETRIWNLNNSLVKNNINLIILHSIDSKGSEIEHLKARSRVYYCKDIRFLGLSTRHFIDFNPFFVFKQFKLLRRQKIDIIQLERPWGFFITKLLKKKHQKIIYDSQGVESENVSIATELSKIAKSIKPFARLYAKYYEKLTCKLSDIIICLSGVDKNYYIKDYKIKKEKIILIQTTSALKYEKILRTEDLKVKCRKRLGLPVNKVICIFHGGLPHPPNREAFDLIIKYISPNIEDPNILFVIAGHNLEKFKNNNIISLGFVKSLKDLLYSADFAIVPIITGGGMRTKIMDYIISALPFITTKKGIQGLDFVKPKKDYLVYEHVDDNFLSGINLLSKNNELREKIHRSLQTKSNLLNREKFGIKFVRLYKELNKRN